MQIVNTHITNLLQARETRMLQKLQMIQDGYHLVSLQLNIPGLPKTNDLLKAFFNFVDARFQEHYLSKGDLQKWHIKNEYSDFAGDWNVFLFKCSTITASKLKEVTEEFEQTFELGRIVDLDVLNSEGIPVSSGKAKPCFICGSPAEECRKSMRHQIQVVRQQMLHAIQSFLEKRDDENLVKRISGFATYALLQEVSLSPKPGLVCRNFNGAHTDMDFATFLKSIAVLSPYFTQIGHLAIDFDDKEISLALPKIRAVGLLMEKAMSDATGNVNTHKGAIFLLSISIFSIIRCIKSHQNISASSFSAYIQALTNGIVERELTNNFNSELLSHGQQCFNNYGMQASGARGEAEKGMPTVINHGLPTLNSLAKKPLNAYRDEALNNILVPVLLSIISANNDTNVLYRKNLQILNILKEKSKQTLAHWLDDNKSSYDELCTWCSQQGISPGGSADLLAVTILLHQCITTFS